MKVSQMSITSQQIKTGYIAVSMYYKRYKIDENSNGYHVLKQLTENRKYDHSTYPSDSGTQIHIHTPTH
jgi:hypothetical protein